MATRNYINGAPLLTLAVLVNDAAGILEVSSTAGFPDAPFTMALERGTVNEEVVLCTAKAATTFTVLRGWDGTTAKGHSIGAAVEHTTAAIDYVEANTHVNDAINDVHPQYILKTAYTAKGRILVGTGAGVTTPLAVGANDRVLIADSATSSGVKWAQIPSAALADAIVNESKLSTSVEQSIVARVGSAPAAINGRVYYNTGDHRFYGRQNGNWRSIVTGAGRVTVGTGAPSGGADGDIHLRY